MSLVTDIAQAVAAELNAAPFSQPFTAEVLYRPVFELKELRTLRVTVVPRAVKYGRLARDTASRTVQVDVGVQQKLADDQGLEPLLMLVEEIAGRFEGRRLAGRPEALCTKIENEPVYAPDHIEQYRQFTSVATLTFEVTR